MTPGLTSGDPRKEKAILTQTEVKNTFDYDKNGHLTWRNCRNPRTKSGAVAGGLSGAASKKRKFIGLNSKKYLCHRLIFLWHHGFLPPSIDHINRNRFDNRIENLRCASNTQQAANVDRHIDNRSGFKGVSYDRGSWRARIVANKKTIELGRFKNKIDAAKKYDEAALELFGEFAVINGVHI